VVHLDPATGEVMRRWALPGRRVSAVVPTRDALVVIHRRNDRRGARSPRGPEQRYTALSHHGVIWETPAHGWAWRLGYANTTGLLYETHTSGLSIMDPQSGRRLTDIAIPEGLMQSPIPFVSRREIIVASNDLDVRVLALRHP
jgi:hypothetical protein